MEKFDDNFKFDITKDQIEDRLFKFNLSKIRESVYQYMLTHKLDNEYFNFEPFYNKYGKNVKYMDEIIEELNQKGWKTKKIFNDTALIITTNNEDIENSIWNCTIE